MGSNILGSMGSLSYTGWPERSPSAVDSMRAISCLSQPEHCCNALLFNFTPASLPFVRHVRRDINVSASLNVMVMLNLLFPDKLTSCPFELVDAVDKAMASASSMGKESCHMVLERLNGMVNTLVEPSSHCLCPSQALRGSSEFCKSELDRGEMPRITIKPRYLSFIAASRAGLSLLLSTLFDARDCKCWFLCRMS